VAPTQLPRPARAALAAASLAIVAGCGSANDAESVPAPTVTLAPTPTTPDSTTPDSTTPDSTTPDSTTPDTTMPVSTTPDSTTPDSTTPAVEPPTPSAFELAIPTGTFETEPTDLFVLVRSGDLELWTGAVTSDVPQRTLVADYPDPFAVLSEGTGPNVVDHVAGEVRGTVVFGDCCEPISGNVIAATDAGEAAAISGGYSPTFSPTGDLLGTANDFVITRTALDPTGAGVSRPLNAGPQQPYLNVADLTWSSNATASADDDRMVLLTWNDDGWWLHDVDRTTLEPTPTTDLGVPPVFEAPDTTMQFAGHGPGSEIVVAQGTPDTIRLRYFDPTTLDERPQLERSLPGAASSVRVADDGLGLLWVDAGALYHLGAGEVEARLLGTEVLAAWFA
jgi:hypothetical protein